MSLPASHSHIKKVGNRPAFEKETEAEHERTWDLWNSVRSFWFKFSGRSLYTAHRFAQRTLAAKNGGLGQIPFNQ